MSYIFPSIWNRESRNELNKLAAKVDEIPHSSDEVWDAFEEQIQNIEANGSIYANKGQVYPFESVGEKRYTPIENAVLDVVVFGAEVGALYRVHHVSKDNDAWGEPVTFIAFQKSVDDGVTWNYVIQRNQANLENGQTGIKSYAITTDGIKEIFNITMNWAALKTGSTNITPYGDYIISPSKYNYPEKEENNLPEYYQNAGLVYPLEVRGANRLEWLDNAILDVKVHYADVNAVYQISHVSKDNTAWGDPATFIQIERSYDNGENFSLLIGRASSLLPNNQSGIQTHVITSDTTEEVVTVTINWDEIRTGSNNVNAYADYIISPINYFFRKSSNSEGGSDLEEYVIIHKNDRKISIKHRLNKDENIIVVYNKLRNNDFHEMSQFYIQGKNTKDNNFTGERVMSTATDFVSPYGMLAVNNAVSGSVGSITVGGAHGTSGGTGFPTGRFGRFVKLELDGKNVVNGYHKGKVLKIDVQHYVSASNVISRSTGTKRDTMLEERFYEITPRHHKVRVKMTALEDIKLTRYAGLQLTQPDFYHSFYRYNNKPEKILPVKGLSEGFHIAEEKDYQKLDRVVMFNDTSMLVMLTDRTFGIGDGHLAPASTEEQEQSPINITGGQFGKIYSHNLGRNNNDVLLRRGNSLEYRGGYYFVENTSTTPNIFRYEIDGVVHTDDLR